MLSRQTTLVVTLGAAVAAGAAVCGCLIRSSQARARKNNHSSSKSLLRPRMSVEPAQHRAVRVPIRKEVKESTSFANFHECVVTHMSLDLTVDFSRKVLTGSVTLVATVKQQGTSELVLDTSGITVMGAKVDGMSAEYGFGVKHTAFGTPLRISIPESCRSIGKEIHVQIFYETSSGSSAVQWLPPEQTAGKVHPYLFTQCQAIHCRSMIPCQDAPCVKSTYDATITVPSPLIALMSAISQGSEVSGNQTVFSFRQEIPMSSYLIALAVGNLESRDIGPRTRVWSEPSEVELAAFVGLFFLCNIWPHTNTTLQSQEFEHTEQFLSVGSEFCGDYVWGRYDLLMLPPSFPYGGMENPCLTFITPTLITGDRSLANVVAHEVCHSWSGNLVTNETWSDFFLNEGFTVFIERKIIARVFGEKAAALKQSTGWHSLQRSIELFGPTHDFTKLHIPMNNVDPDDCFSSVPYEKGFAFLKYLEQLVGGPSEFEPFLKAYMLRFQYGTVSWDQFKAFFLEYFMDENSATGEKVKAIDWNLWIHQPGLPPEPEVDTSLLDMVLEATNEWLTTGTCPTKLDSNWSSDQKVIFLEKLLVAVIDDNAVISMDLLDKIDARYEFSSTRNSEILFGWCMLCVKVQDTRKFDLAVKFLSEQGRMKFVRPLYRELAKGQASNAIAKQAFAKLKNQYHSIAQKMIASDLQKFS